MNKFVAEVLFMLPALLLFAVPHSLLASALVKDFFGRRLGKNMAFYRIFYNLVAVLTIIPLLFLMWAKSEVVFSWGAPVRPFIFTFKYLSLVGLFFSVKGFFGELSGLGYVTDYLKNNGSNGKTGDAPSIDKLRTDGFFRMSRHPIYFFTLSYLWLSPSMTIRYLATVVLSTIYIYIATFHEESRLEKEHEEYKEYAKNTSRIIPLKWLLLKSKKKGPA